MEQMNITSAVYNYDEIAQQNGSIQAVIDGKTWSVPLDEANRHYAEILRQVEDGSLVIEPAGGEQ